MKNKYIRCINIVHHPAEVRVYRMLSAFFRLVGIFVCENLAVDEYGDEADWSYTIKKGSEDEPELLESQVSAKICEMEEVLEEESLTVLKGIWKMFWENDLMRKSYAVDYFSNVGIDYIYRQMEESMNAFEEVLTLLERLEQGRDENALGNVYIWMAKASCRRRIRELYTIVWNAVERGEFRKEINSRDVFQQLYDKHYIDIEDVFEDIQKVLDEDPQFFAAYAVRGFVKENNDKYRIDSVDDLKQAVSMIGDKSYSSYLQYRIGRYYEKVRPNMSQKMDYYRKAVEADSRNFRAVYKLALYEEDQRNYEKAMELWKNIINILEAKQHLPSLQPIECAYLYKAYRKVGELYNRAGYYEKGIQKLKEAESVYHSNKNGEEKKGFYPWMFGTDLVEHEDKMIESWEIYKKAARAKLEIMKVYVAITDASARANMRDVHIEYMGKMMQLGMLA